MSHRMSVLIVILGFALAAWGPVVGGAVHDATRFQPQPAQTTSVVAGAVTDEQGSVLPGVRVTLQQADLVRSTTTDQQGQFRFDRVAPGRYVARAALAGFKTVVQDVTVTSGVTATIAFALPVGAMTEEVRVPGDLGKTVPVAPPPPAVPPPANAVAEQSVMGAMPASRQYAAGRGGRGIAQAADSMATNYRYPSQRFNTEAYAPIVTNPFKRSIDDPLSTFAADVDTASFTNVRRFLNDGQLPPPDAVRVEELINYFRFPYPDPESGRPVSITTEVGDAPWAPGHKLVLVGLKAKPIDAREVAGRNLVLLIDVSGSMGAADKLPLLKTGLRMFVDSLRDDDRLAIVVYAGASGLVLPSTPARHRQRIHDAIESLHSGGSTNGAQGLQLAYKVAQEHFIHGGINRVILATDGDFNVGVTSQGDLLRLIETKKQSGIFLSVLGVGTGNLKDSTMELLADKGNGNYAYLDSLHEARRVLVREGGATLETVAKDVKFQVEFNPARVAAWRLIGYENRLLAHADFNNDKKDGGELGSGHTVTVLYEIVPAGVPLPKELAPEDGRPVVDELVYQTDRRPAGSSPDLLTVKVRYKKPDEDVSALMTQPVRATAAGTVRSLPFAAAVAEFGMLLRDAEAPSARWTTLTGRLDALPVAVADAADRQNFRELVELAAGLRRIKTGAPGR